MSDPITATIQVAQLGISAVRAGAAIANAWSNRSQRKAAEPSTESAANGNPFQGASIEEILLVLATLGQRLLLLDVVDFDVLPQASEAVRSAMRAVDSKSDDVGEDFDDLEPILQHLVACAYVFCAACHPMPIWHGFGCAIMDRTDWATPEKPNYWINDVDKGIAFLKSVPQPWKLLKKSPSAISKEEPDFEKTDKKSRKLMEGVLEDVVKQFEKHGMPQPLPPNNGIVIRTWGFAFATYGGSSFYMDVGHNTKLVARFQADAGRFLYAWTVGERADLRAGDAIVFCGKHIGALAEWLEGLNGMSHKVLKDTELDWSKVKFKSSTRKLYKAHCGHEQGLNDEAFVMVRNPDPMAHIAKRLDELHFVPTNVTASAAPTASPVNPVDLDDKKGARVSISSISPPQSPIRNSVSNPLSPTIVPVVRRKPVARGDSQVSGTSTADSQSNAGSTAPTSPISTQASPCPIPSNPASPLEPSLTSLPSPGLADTYALPSGWEERHLPDGRSYYIDHVTRTTSWERPAMTDPAAPPSYEASTAPEPEKPLPPGWEMRIDPQRRLYYVDHNTQLSTWERPVG
ncbi:hypothetical protein M409DRAFT_56217 [Zasmidium cellare ATCC 36951]|uniref:WW domain-containing protein n=1 Tax=Zasmidium cellare ATCC 36951 TaxID=1080233 RepID=A0A6A6CHF7_ZASCE|nr:uncharacterized protein M409DRAFT_56217 [Zasmidium cellare ATCC 36951]KAF2164846.1 hypothetical protein M409DRAFT_56217 [Zasmidium cellare ATCC 36951]